MKKNAVFCFFTVAILSSLFADHDIILAPSVGYTYTNAFTVKNPINPSSENIDYFKAHNGYLEFTVGVILDNGFTFIEDAGFAAGPAYVTDSQMRVPSFFFIFFLVGTFIFSYLDNLLYSL